jgi:hypothetical protein
MCLSPEATYSARFCLKSFSNGSRQFSGFFSRKPKQKHSLFITNNAVMFSRKALGFWAKGVGLDG